MLKSGRQFCSLISVLPQLCLKFEEHAFFHAGFLTHPYEDCLGGFLNSFQTCNYMHGRRHFQSPNISDLSNLTSFKRLLKTELYHRAYHCWSVTDPALAILHLVNDSTCVNNRIIIITIIMKTFIVFSTQMINFGWLCISQQGRTENFWSVAPTRHPVKGDRFETPNRVPTPPPGF